MNEETKCTNPNELFWRLQPVYINSQKQLKLNLQKQPYQMAVLLGHTALPNANVM